MAVHGGMLADRMAWVFVAGYQAALRRTFPDQALPRWAALAVSEIDAMTHRFPGGLSAKRWRVRNLWP